MKISTERLKQIIKEELQQDAQETMNPIRPVLNKFYTFKQKLESEKHYELADELSDILGELHEAIGRQKALNK